MEITKKYWYVLLIVLMILVIIFITYNTSSAGETYTKITVKEAEVLMKEKDITIIDVRTSEEYQKGHIEASINIPYDQITSEKIKLEKTEKIIVYCQSGKRSQKAANTLTSLGYTIVYDMGGINNWNGKLTTE